MVGTAVKPADTYKNLQWFGGDLTWRQYEKAYEAMLVPLEVVRLKANGSVDSVIVHENAFEYGYGNYLTVPAIETPRNAEIMNTTRKTKHKDSELCIAFYPGKNGLPLNTEASQMFKMQIYGDVIILGQHKELCHKARYRYADFTLQHYHDLLLPKRKREKAMEQVEYSDLKTSMQQALNVVEARSSSSAREPSALAQGAAMPPFDGKELAAVAVAMRPAKVQAVAA